MPEQRVETVGRPYRWVEIVRPGRIAVRMQIREDAVYAEVSNPERTLLHDRGFVTHVEHAAKVGDRKIGKRNLFRIPPAALPLALPELPPEVEAHVRAARPDWFAWLDEERRRHEARARRAVELGLRAERETPLPKPDGLFEQPPRWRSDGLRPFQDAGVEWMIDAGGIALCGDDMGLGKTNQGLRTLEALKSKKTLVVSPAVGLFNWRDECRRWTPGILPLPCTGSVRLQACLEAASDARAFRRALAEIRAKHEPASRRAITAAAKRLHLSEAQVRWCLLHVPDEGDDAALLIVSWGLLPRVIDRLLDARFDTVVFDEGHYGGNAESARGDAMIRLCHQAAHRLILTGTAERNRNIEWWALLHALDPLAWPLFIPFAERYGGAKTVQRPGGAHVRTYRGSVRKKELNKLLRPWVLRRTKIQVLKDLPPKQRTFLRLPCEDAKLLDRTEKLREALRSAVERQDEPSALGELAKIRQEIGLAKVPAAVEWISDALAQGEPVVVFVWFKGVHQALCKALDEAGVRYGSVVGSTSLADRKRVQDEFQDGKLDVVIGSSAAKENLTLVRARFTLHIDRWLVHADEEQAEDRINRIGQTRGAQNIYLELEGTTDEDIHDLVEQKRSDVDAVQQRGSIEKQLLHHMLDAHRRRVSV